MKTAPTVMNVPFVDLKAQYLSIKDEIDAAISAVIGKTAFVGGPFVKEFEEAFAAYCGVQHCVGVANGTDAIFIALKVLGIGPGDEVITAANSFVATSEAITMAGAKVVFVDIDPKTYNIDAARIEEKITDRTKAIIPVHLYGQPADMDPILAIAKQHGLRVVADAAQAHGSLYKERKIATLADITCYSFYPGKNLGAYGDGGALVTDYKDWAAKARMFANHGRSTKFGHEFEGVNSRLDGLQAAILNVKLRHLDAWTDKRRAAASRYNELLSALTPGTRNQEPGTPYEPAWTRAVYHLYVIRVQDRARFQDHLKANGVNTGIHYPIALPYLNAYKHLAHSEDEFPVALKASREIVSLPMFPELTEEQIAHVVEQIGEFKA
jgi:dTDP-4-amino-4,6-dideoxygalactose transaminase